MRVIVEKQPAVIAINGRRFEIHAGDDEVLALSRDAYERAMKLAALRFDDGAVLDYLRWAADQIDRVLGDGTMRTLCGTSPVDFATVTKIINGMAEACGRAHAAYLAGRYIDRDGAPDMETFSLSAPGGLPTTAGGVEIETDFRVILRCLRLLGDEALDRDERTRLLTKMFYRDNPPRDAWGAFERFVSCGRERGEGSGVKDFDYEQDAMEIYSAFRKEYGIDLLNEDMHWWKFCALLDGVMSGDNALTNKIALRHIDDSKSTREAATARAKEAAALATSVSAEEMDISRQIEERLKKGEPIDDLINRGGE